MTFLKLCDILSFSIFNFLNILKYESNQTKTHRKILFIVIYSRETKVGTLYGEKLV